MDRLALANLLAARNRELMMEATLSIGLGVVYTLLTCGLLFWLTWYYIGRALLNWGSGAVVAGVAVTAVYMFVATWTAWRRVEPMQGFPVDAPYDALNAPFAPRNTGLPVVDRHAAAAGATALMAGPLNIFEGIADFRRRLPSDHMTIAAAASILKRAAHGLHVTADLNGETVVMLHRLALIKIGQESDRQIILLTAKGRGTLRASAS